MILPFYQGQDLYTNKALRDKQIVRVLGKVSFEESVVILFSVCFQVDQRMSSVIPNWRVLFTFLILQVPTLAAAAYLRMAGRPPVLPSNQLSYAENFLYMLDSLCVS